MSETAILALDLATYTGWAKRDRRALVTSGVERFPVKRGESPGMRFLRFRDWLVKQLEEDGATRTVGRNEYETETVVDRVRAVDVIAYELPHHRGGHSTASAVGLQAIVQEEGARRGIEVAAVHTATLKSHSTRNGGADKNAMIRAAARRFPGHWPGINPVIAFRLEDLPEGEDDRADAMCVLGWALDGFPQPQKRAKKPRAKRVAP